MVTYKARRLVLSFGERQKERLAMKVTVAITLLCHVSATQQSKKGMRARNNGNA